MCLWVLPSPISWLDSSGKRDAVAGGVPTAGSGDVQRRHEALRKALREVGLALWFGLATTLILVASAAASPAGDVVTTAAVIAKLQLISLFGRLCMTLYHCSNTRGGVGV